MPAAYRHMVTNEVNGTPAPVLILRTPNIANYYKIRNSMKQSRKPNMYAFIDSQNLNLGVQKMGWKMDWRKFRQYLANEYGVTKAYMFIGHVPEFEDMYVHMHELGFLV